MKQTVVVGVTSGIAAVKVPELIRLLRGEGLVVEVVMTASAVKMMGPEEFEKASGHRVYTHLFEENFDYEEILKNRHVEHIDLADRASVIVVCPTTANILAKLATGIADDFLTTTILATRAQVLLCPSMNVHMWNNPVVQENLETLRRRGFYILDPTVGKLACGYEGKGRLEDITHIKDEVMELLRRSNTLKDKRVIVTAGGTVEPIDAVRVMTNRSSGKMGAALADACAERGADVTLVRARSAVSSRNLIKEKIFETAKDLETILQKEVKHADIIFHCAAVSDFTLAKSYEGKLSSEKTHTLKLLPSKKILSLLKQWNPKLFVVGFKAAFESNRGRLQKIAMEKLRESKVDMIVANDVSRSDRGFMADTNEVVLVSNKSVEIIPLATKREVARVVCEFVTSHLHH